VQREEREREREWGKYIVSQSYVTRKGSAMKRRRGRRRNKEKFQGHSLRERKGERERERERERGGH
jgi:hypothetical protein